MLYKDKTVALIGSGHEAELDVEFLRGICKEVLHFTDNKPYSISGGMKADTVSDGKESYKVDGVFVIKDTVSVTKLVEGLEYRKGGIVVDEKMQTNIPGIFAAGDCAGLPYQLAKAAGDGNVAALSACDYLKGK
jgi:thioredoxin reductase (NADPH)